MIVIIPDTTDWLSTDHLLRAVRCANVVLLSGVDGSFKLIKNRFGPCDGGVTPQVISPVGVQDLIKQDRAWYDKQDRIRKMDKDFYANAG